MALLLLIGLQGALLHDTLAAEPLAERATLAGDPLDAKRTLGAAGIVPGIGYIAEGFTDLGRASGNEIPAEHRLEALLDVDLQALAGWTGASVHAHAYSIAGRGMSEALGNQFTVSGIEAAPAHRLFDVWIEQQWDDGRFSLRGGRMAADDEFIVSATAATFLNGTFGWPAIAAANLPNGGPATPEARPGVRARIEAGNNLAILAAAFAADRHGGDAVPSGARHGGLLIAEVQKASGGDGDAPTAFYKLGGWYQMGRSPRLRDPLGRTRSGNFGVYGIVDRTLWAAAGEGARIDAFVRAGASPGDRNPVTSYVDAGIAATGLWASRPDDVLGLAAAYGRIRPDSGEGSFPNSDESLIELSYRAQLAPCCSLQPDFQLIRYRPGDDPVGRRRTALVIGLRTSIQVW